MSMTGAGAPVNTLKVANPTTSPATNPTNSDLLASIQEMQAILAQLYSPGTTFPNPIVGALVAPLAAGGGNQVQFQITSLVQLAVVAIFRNVSLDQGSAILLQTYDANALKVGQELTYSDTDPSIAGQNVVYFVVGFPLYDNLAPIWNGPFTVGAANSSLVPPDQITDFFASKSPGVGGIQPINVVFVPPDDPNFGSAKIYIEGYKGSNAAVAIAQNATSPFTFNLEETGETVTLICVSVSAQGIEAPQSGAPTVTLTLDGVESVPAPIEDCSAAALTTGVQISWAGSPEPDVSEYKIYRGPFDGGFGAASVIGTVAATGAGSYSFLDTTGLASYYEWYITAVNPAGESAPSPELNVFAVLSSSQLPPNVPQNFGNNATVDSIDAGSSATVRIYGPGGVGTTWTRTFGSGTMTFAAGSITGLAYATLYYVVWNGSSYVALTSILSRMPDNYYVVGSVTTVAMGGGGGSNGGGGNDGGGNGGKKPPSYD